MSTAKVSGGYTYSWNTAEEKWHRQARADRCEALTQALPARQAAVEDRDASPRRTHFDRRSRPAGRKQADRLLGVEISAADDDYHAAVKAMAAWLDEHSDPTPFLAALAIGYLETCGTKSSPLRGCGDAGTERVDSCGAWLDTNADLGA